jgi:cation-transporting ATPase 13A3/4/5
LLIISPSVPTSVSSFAHRRHRADSTASFTYYPDDEEEDTGPFPDEEVVLDEDDDDDERFEEQLADLEAGELASLRRTSSGYSRGSVHDRLLRSDSARTEGSRTGQGSRGSQKIYIVNEDLTIVVAGFRSSTIGYSLYTTICILTFGLAFLLLRWLPRWKVRLIGNPAPLNKCNWVAIEVSTDLSIWNQGAVLTASESMGRIRDTGCLVQGIWEVTICSVWIRRKAVCYCR